MKKSKVVAIILAILICSTIYSIPASAAVDYGTDAITPMWTNTSTIALSISYSGTNATCTIDIQGYSGTTKVDATIRLYKLVNGVWILKNTWNETSSKTYLVCEEKALVDRGYRYKLEVSATVLRYGSNEYITVATEKDCP